MAFGRKRHSKRKDSGEVNEGKVHELLNKVYDVSLSGIPNVERPLDQLADDYLSRHKTKESAAKALIRNQVAKCGTIGFVTNLGGMITLPIALTADVSSVMYIQMRMVAAVAAIGGYDTKSDQVKTLVILCLTGQAMADIVKSVGMSIGTKMGYNLVGRIPGRLIYEINKKVGFYFLTRFGQKGIVRISGAVPIIGGFIGGGFDAATTKIIANNAYKTFIANKGL
jgi:hypothetical protein